MRRRLPAPLRLIACCGTGLLLLAMALVARGQSVTTIGGGPNSLPITIDNSHGSEDGITRSGTDSTGGNPGARFYEPYGEVLDSTGNLYIADRLNGSVRKVSNPGNTSTSFTSTIRTGLNQPVAVARDSGDSLYVLTQGDGTIRKISTSGTLLGTVTAALVSPTAMAIDLTTTNIYVTELGGALKMVTPAGVITTLSGGFITPRGVAIYGTNSLAVSDSHRVQIFSLTNNTVLLTYGSTTAGFSNGLPATALFNTPYQIATAPDLTIVVADRLNHKVRYITPGGTVKTLYGAPTNEWNTNFFTGWADGTNAHSRDPVGVVVSPSGTNVFVTEVAWNLLRAVGGISFAAATSGTSTNTTPDVGSLDGDGNFISFGFQSGEGSSAFKGAPGQFFTAPVTLVLTNSSLKIYSIGFTLAVTNETGPVLAGGSFGFSSRVQRPAPELGSGLFLPIPPQFLVARTTNITFDANGAAVTNIVPIFTNSIFTSIPPKAFLGISWLEIPGQTNLYDTGAQDLVTYSQAHIDQFAKPNTLLGAFGFRIPTTAVNGQTYLIRAFNASGEAGFNVPVDIVAPTNGATGAGIRNSLKRVTVQDGIQYLVGDISTFRWFNAGDFGNGTLDIDDAHQTFMSTIYRLNVPPVGTDFFDAMDSSNGATNSLLDASSGDIDGVQFGDGELNVDDVFVTLRRYQLPFKWFNRYWSNGVQNAVEVPNLRFSSDPFANRPAVQLTATQPSASSGASSVVFSAGDAVAANGVVTIPVKARVIGSRPLKALMLRLTVKPLDGSPYLTQPIQFTFAQGTALGPAFDSGYPSPTSFFGVWLNVEYVNGLTEGESVIGNVQITLPAGAPSTAAYSIHFDHASSSPNGIALFPKNSIDGLVTTSDRSGSSYGDGIPDSWRLRYFGTLNNVLSAANADADGDGIPNWAEYKAGTDPLDNLSSFRVRSFQKEAQSGNLVLHWPSVAGKSYQIEYASSITSDTWTSAGVVTGTGGEMEFRDTNTTGVARFYRVRLIESGTSQ